MDDIYRRLETLRIAYHKYSHPAVFTVEESDRHTRHLQGGRTKNLFLRNKRGDRHYLLVVERSKRVDLKKLRKIVDEATLSFASPERLEKYLGVTPGAVSPLGLIHDRDRAVIVLVDEDLMKEDVLNFHPNENTATLALARRDFERFVEDSGHELQALVIPERDRDSS